MKLAYNREYCCPACGLIWISKENICPECGNKYNFAVDTFGWAFCEESVVKELEKHNKKIHYHKDHPWYKECD